MNETLSAQNLIEAELALERLKELVGQSDFRRERQKTEALLKQLKLEPEALSSYLEKLEGVQSEQFAQFQESSAEVRAELETHLAEMPPLLALAPDALSNWEQAQQQLNDARDKLDTVRQHLDFQGRKMLKSDLDACWEQFKDYRKQLRHLRNGLFQQVDGTAQQLLSEAESAVNEESQLSLAREAFQSCQKQINQLPLRREQRQHYHQHFDGLWKQLQQRSQQHRAERQQRQAEGLKRLEEALQRVESFIQRVEPELNLQEQQLQEAHWHEAGSLEKQVQRNRDALEDAQRRRREIQAKLDDARQRSSR